MLRRVIPLEPGRLFDRYRIEDVVGHGGMGLVYRAFDTRLKRLVALKVLQAEAGDDAGRQAAAQSLLTEARTAAKLSHPNVIAIFDVGTAEDLPFLTMELITGKTLRAQGFVPTKQKLEWLRDVALGLGAAHRVHLVHRDVKPDNVMVREDGRAVVLDFGIARRSADGPPGTLPTATLVGKRVRGTVPYMAPEQIMRTMLDGRTDQFAWGVVAYELLSGSLPWGEGEPMHMVNAILSGDPLSLTSAAPDVPTDVGLVVARAMAKDPKDRFATMDEVAALLDAVIAGGARAGGVAMAPPPELASTLPASARAASIARASVRAPPAPGGAVAEARPRRLRRGDTAPDIHAMTTQGKPFVLSSSPKPYTVVYFFPKAFTPGCTREAHLFRDNYAELMLAGAAVVGISTDDHETQCKFAASTGVPFPMIADKDGAISRAYGVLWPLIRKPKRLTFVVDRSRKVLAEFRHELSIIKHRDDVLRFFDELRHAAR
jgi:peroxiredoxin